MAADYILVSAGFPGGPYRVDVTETAAGDRFTAAEMCMCGATDGPHWHELGLPAAAAFSDLLTELLARHLAEVATP